MEGYLMFYILLIFGFYFLKKFYPEYSGLKNRQGESFAYLFFCGFYEIIFI